MTYYLEKSVVDIKVIIDNQERRLEEVIKQLLMAEATALYEIWATMSGKGGARTNHLR